MKTIFPNRYVTILVLLLICLNIFSWASYLAKDQQVSSVQRALASADKSTKIMTFQRLLVADVLDSTSTVDRSTRLSLNQAAADTGSNAVITAWNSFLAAPTESDAQAKLKSLLAVMATEASQ